MILKISLSLIAACALTTAAPVLAASKSAAPTTICSGNAVRSVDRSSIVVAQADPSADATESDGDGDSNDSGDTADNGQNGDGNQNGDNDQTDQQNAAQQDSAGDSDQAQPLNAYPQQANPNQ